MEGKAITANGKSRRANSKKSSAPPSPSPSPSPSPPPPPADFPPPPSPANPPPPPPLAQQLPPFLSKCYDMVDDPSTDATVSWNAAGISFVVWDQHAFARDLLPQYFKHNNLASFVRQLNTYGFRKVDPDRWEFANEGFLRGQKHLLKTILRRKPPQNPVQPNMPEAKKDPSVKACVEVGKFGFEEEIEMLKRDKSVLMQELVKLRQHQQNTDNELRIVRDRIQVMEQQQQQMMSFLAMAVQNPGFMAQLVQQNGNNWWRVDTNKKRRLPALEQGIHGVETSSEGQIVKYQAVVTENSNPLLTPVPNGKVTPDLSPLSDGVNDLHINMDGMSFEMESSLSIADGFLSDIPDEYLDLEKLLASPVPENNREPEPHNPGISDVGMDFDSPEQEIHVETSQDLVHPNEHMVVEHPLYHMDNKY